MTFAFLGFYFAIDFIWQCGTENLIEMLFKYLMIITFYEYYCVLNLRIFNYFADCLFAILVPLCRFIEFIFNRSKFHACSIF